MIGTTRKTSIKEFKILKKTGGINNET